MEGADRVALRRSVLQTHLRKAASGSLASERTFVRGTAYRNNGPTEPPEAAFRLRHSDARSAATNIPC